MCLQKLVSVAAVFNQQKLFDRNRVIAERQSESKGAGVASRSQSTVAHLPVHFHDRAQVDSRCLRKLSRDAFEDHVELFFGGFQFLAIRFGDASDVDEY